MTVQRRTWINELWYQMDRIEWINELSHIFNGILYENEQVIVAYNNTDISHKYNFEQKRPDTQNTYFMIPFI